MKSWMEYACTCPSCMQKCEEEYYNARTKWNHGIRKVELKSWDTHEAYGTTMYINGLEVGEVEANTLAVVELLCEFLDINDVKTGYIEEKE
jgi:hypothetical protein